MNSGEVNPGAEEEMRILVVDNDGAIRELLEDHLSLCGHEVLVATNGKEALSHFRSGSVQMMFTGRTLPDLRAEELARRVRAQGYNAPIIVMPALALSLTEVNVARAAGVSVVLNKPFSLDAIDAVLGMFPQS